MSSTYSERIRELVDNNSVAVKDLVKKLVDEAYNEGYNDGLGVELPTQEQFDKDHTEVMGYGEEDDWLVVSENIYSEEDALELFKKHIVSNGWYSEDDTDELEVVLNTISIRWVGYRRGGDDKEPLYWLFGKNDTAPTFWRAWVVETQP